ncbi:MAG TPA: galactokinase family protein, partial [Acidimicrobiia bacterium]|nr:galactokinase family protein [Acidimicrobiia bacterium]
MRVRAPGRVNLIGDHTDYQDGLCLPMAIDREVVVDWAPSTASVSSFRSAEPESGLVAAAPAVLAERGIVPRIVDAAVTSTIPVGGGLSSSAAFTVACLLALTDELSGRELALAAQAVEQRATGVPCGVMDQMASVCGRPDHALLLDCRTLAVTPVPLPPGCAVIVVHSGLPRRLATSAYAKRRAACERAAARLGVAALRDASLSDVADDPMPRHVVSENARVLAAADALRAGDVAMFGRLMDESHASLRDDFAVSTPELDEVVEHCRAEGAYGARLTGA